MRNNLMNANVEPERDDLNMVALYILLRVNQHLINDEPMESEWLDASFAVDDLISNFDVVERVHATAPRN
jgi:hypothetical protein